MEDNFSSPVCMLPGLAQAVFPERYLEHLNQRRCGWTRLGVDQRFWFKLAALYHEVLSAVLDRGRTTIAPGDLREIEARLRCFNGGHSIPYKINEDQGSRKIGSNQILAAIVTESLKEEFVKIKGSLISVVDDDESVRESLPDLLREFGFTPKVFSSAEEFLLSDCVSRTQCLILDVAMPGMSGPDLQLELAHRQQEIPIIFITATSSAAVRLNLLKQGAVECLFKPFSDSALLDALNAALAKI
jgi:CheY-like chemotaxis protein